MGKRGIAIAKFKCEYHGTDLANYDEGRNKSSELAHKAYSDFGYVSLSAVKSKPQNVLCDDGHQLCDMLVGATVSAPGVLDD